MFSPIDPGRPWIDDPRDAPAAMRWGPSFLNPLGKTTRLHFTRGWTAVFMVRLAAFTIPPVMLSLLVAAGANDAAALVPPLWTVHLVILVTALMSAALHLRRLADARRSPLWAVLVLVPVMFGALGFIGGTVHGSAAYQKAVEAQAAPPEARITQTGERNQATQEARRGARGEGRRGRQGEPLDVTEVSARSHALQSGLNAALAVWALPSFLVMLWTLLWVARLPNGGGTIASRVTAMRAKETSGVS